ncbi:MAG: LD-carboxypeptidase, partial [Nostoc sp.]
MTIKRRQFLRTCGLVTLATQIPGFTAQGKPPNTIRKPPRLQVGDTVGLIAPAGIVDTKDIEAARKSITQLGLKVKLGAHILDRYGYLAGKD